jgi:hypothetical protein
MSRSLVLTGLIAATSILAVLGAGCGEMSFGGCADTQTCAVDAALADQTASPLDAGAPDGASSGVDATVEGSVSSDASGLPTADADASLSALADASVDANADASDGFVCELTASPHDAPCVLNTASGIFVAPAWAGGADTSANGSMVAPYLTIGYALAHLTAASRVYVCAGTYAEAMTLTAAADVYGGLQCSDAGAAWAYVDGGRSQVVAPANGIALVVSGADGGVDLEDMAFAAPDASGQDDAGNGLSSLAALVRNSSVTFRRCVFTAGSGANGADGATGANFEGAVAQDGQLANDAGIGGDGGVAVCGDGTSSQGGNGGNGTLAGGTPNAGNGGAMPPPPVNLILGLDGIGGQGGVRCSSGDDGANGLATPGGDAGAFLGDLTALGWTPTQGKPGGSGKPGQGGGGGGAKNLLGGTGGGAGGCGGFGGAGGGGGGGSIALACLAGSVTLDDCVLTTSSGGAGGRGGDGQPGQGGGLSPAVPGTCSGGYGGNGAGGSGGAGGTGGIAACVVYDMASSVAGTPLCTLGAAGAAGVGGAGQLGGTNALGTGASGSDGGAGLSGAAEDQLAL